MGSILTLGRRLAGRPLGVEPNLTPDHSAVSSALRSAKIDTEGGLESLQAQGGPAVLLLRREQAGSA